MTGELALSLALLASGLALLLAGSWQALLARRLRATHAALTRIDDADLTAFAAAAWPVLARAGVASLRWQGEWFGRTCAGERGAATANADWRSRIRAGEDVEIGVEASFTGRRGERAWLARAALDLFALLWQARAEREAARIDGALRTHALRSVTLLHEMRNFAQWALWSAEDAVRAVDQESMLEVASRFRESAPLVIQRARHLLEATARAPLPENAAPPRDLPQLVTSCAQLHGLHVALEAEPSVTSSTAAETWLLALDNLFVNLRQSSPAAEIAVRLAHVAGVATLEVRLAQEDFAGCLDSLFEPFASTRALGLGLGLYLARRAARRAGGDLVALEQPARFRLTLP